MGENFKQLKRKALILAIAESLITGISAGAFTVGLVMLSCRLCGVGLWALWYVLIGIGGFALGFGISFPLLFVTDKKLAVLLDSEVGRERVLTSLGFKDDGGEISSLLLADTGERLASVKIKFTKLWAYILALVLSVGLAVAAPFVPLKQTSTEEPEPPFIFTEWQDEALTQLIEYVQASDADEQTKTGTIAEISALAALKNGSVAESEMKTFVNYAADNIRTVYDTANLSYRVAEGEEEPEEYRIQRQNNTNVGEYAITKLYEIFGITPPENSENNQGSDPVDPDDDPITPGVDPVNPGGELISSQEKFFDPELGYISYSQVIEKYYAVIGDAMDDGVISSDEWFSIVMLYYQMLDGAN